MKKILLTAAFAVIGLVSVNAQTGVEGTIHVGIPTGNASDVSSFNLGVDLAYLAPLANNFKLGGKVGYDHFIGKSNFDDFGYVPLAATGKYEFSNNVFIGMDLGYAISTKSYIDGGLFYQPKIGYSAATWDVYAGFKGINSGIKNYRGDFNANAFSFGFAYKF